MTLWCSKSPFLYKKPDIITSSAATLTLGPEIGAHNWNTHKSTPNKHIKQEWCETIGKYLIKWLKTWIIIYLGAQYDLEIGPLGPIFNTPQKLARIDMYTKTDAKLVENFWENDQKTGILTYLGAQSGPEIGTLRPIFSTHMKLLGMSMWRNTVVKPVRTFWGSDQTPEICLTLGPKWPRNWPLRGTYHFAHLWQ